MRYKVWGEKFSPAVPYGSGTGFEKEPIGRYNFMCDAYRTSIRRMAGLVESLQKLIGTTTDAPFAAIQLALSLLYEYLPLEYEANLYTCAISSLIC